MPFMDYFRKFFNLPPKEDLPRFRDEMRDGDSFRNPIWQSDEDEDDVSDFSDRRPRNGFHFKVFSDPLEVTKFFESQMDDMLKSFFHNFDSFDNGQSFAIPFEDGFKNFQPKDENLREQFLKPGYDLPSKEPKQDSDLDGKVSSSDLAKMWKSHSKVDAIEEFQPQFSVKSFGKSVSTKIVRRPDGTVEQHHSVKDSNGNEEIKITRQIGDKVHTIVTKKTRDGVEEQSENLINMDESEIKDFNQKWSKSPAVLPEEKAHDFPWHKFFGPSPKL